MKYEIDIFTHRHALEQFKQYVIDQTGYIADENPFSNLSIIRAMQEVRASQIKQIMVNGGDISDHMVQVLPCVSVEELDRAECPCAPASGCYWLRTKDKVPNFIKAVSITGIVASGTNPRFQFIKWTNFQYIPYSRSKTVQNGLYWSIKNTGGGDYIYLYGNRFLEAIAISAIFEDPMNAAAYPVCGKIQTEAFCNPLDVNFYTDTHLRNTIISEAWQKLLAARGLAQIDVLNDDISGNNPAQSK